jgi:hypothetical protein
MQVTAQLAKHFREVCFGGNWTWSNLKDNLAGLDWQQATTKIDSLNTILALTYHINYFVRAATDVLQGKPLTAHDKYSFDHPPIHSQEDWEAFVASVYEDGETFAVLIEQLPDSKLSEIFVEEKYGTYFRNIQGIIEHTHYHLGQIAIIKKLVAAQ